MVEIMKKKQFGCIVMILSSLVLMRDISMVSMVMLAVVIHIFADIFPTCRRNRDYWFFTLTAIMFIPQNMILTRRIYRIFGFIFEGKLASITLFIIIGLFLFSIEQIVFGCMHQWLSGRWSKETAEMR